MLHIAQSDFSVDKTIRTAGYEPRANIKDLIEIGSTMIKETPRFASEPSVAWDKEHMSVLIAVDTSGSVEPAIQNINANLNHFKENVCENDIAAKCVDVCVMTFDDSPRVIQDWCPIQDMNLIELDAAGCTDLNGAIISGIDKIRERSREYQDLEKKPYLIVMTDGYDNVTGNVDAAAEYAAERISEGKLKLFFLGFGEYDKTTAAQLCRTHGNWCFEVKDGDFDFNDFFDFVGNSVKAASVSAPNEIIHVETAVGTDESNVKVVSLDSWLND